jgi:hypothetical protein
MAAFEPTTNRAVSARRNKPARGRSSGDFGACDVGVDDRGDSSPQAFPRADADRDSRWAGYGQRGQEPTERYEPMPPLIELPRWLWRKLPRWGRAAALLLAAAAIAGIVAAMPGTVASKRSAKQEGQRIQREARRRLALDQRPNFRSLRTGSAPIAQLRHAILDDARQRARRRLIAGPIVSVTCTRVASDRSGRTAFACAAETPVFKYPFQGVTDTAHRTVTWCKRDPPAEQSLDVPLDERCSF